MRKDKITTWVLSYLKEKERADIKLTDRFTEDLCYDSLDIVEIIMDCEVKFNIEISDYEFPAYEDKTIQDLVQETDYLDWLLDVWSLVICMME